MDGLQPGPRDLKPSPIEIPIVAFHSVSKTFGTVPAVRDITLEVTEGEIVTILGPSGCGKSTLLNMAAGLFAPSTGQVTYRGQPVPRPNTAVGYMTQKDHLLPWRSVAGNIAVPLEIRGVPKAEASRRVAELIAMVGLGGFERTYPDQLSGGMRKRTALARLLAYDPETLLLDEPFAALDPQLRAGMQQELLRLCRDLGKTVLFVTHDLDEAAALGDRCVVFSGRGSGASGCKRSPGTIHAIVPVPLPPGRDPMRLRADPVFQRLTAQLWDMMAPDPDHLPDEAHR